MKIQKSLGLAEARRAIDAVIDAATQAKHDGVAVVVVDKGGEIVASARMDGRAPRFIKAAHRKAYTGAVFESDTSGIIKLFQKQEEAGHRGPPDWNDPMLTTLAGGFAIIYEEEVVGGIGVAGGNPHIGDPQFAEIAVKALGPGFSHRELAAVGAAGRDFFGAKET